MKMQGKYKLKKNSQGSAGAGTGAAGLGVGGAAGGAE